MERMQQPSGCPSCAEPLEEGDLFCGRCGHDLSSPPPQADRPTLAVSVQPPAQGYAPTAPAPAPGGFGPAGAFGSAAPAPGLPAPGWEGMAGAAAAVPQAAGDSAGRPGTEATAPDGWEQHRPTRYDGPSQDPYGAAARHNTPGVPGPYDGAAAGAGGHARHDAHGASAGGADHGEAAGHGEHGRYDTPAPAEPAASPAPAPAPAAPAPGGKACVACRAGRVDTDGYCENCGHAQPRERDHVEEELGSVAAVSDRGLRHHRNEDSFAVSATALPDGSAATIAIVCDGVSSASRPDDASAAAAAAANEALLDALPRGAHPQEAMHSAILAAANAVNALAPEVPGAQNAPACTLVGAVVSGGLLTVGWVGDSRAYWVPDDRAALPHRLTEDDSWAAQMVAAGLMGEAEAYADVRAHAITGWLGADAYELEPHTKSFRPDHPGVVIVCTDGLWNYAESAAEMASVVPVDASSRPLHSAQVLVGHALDGGGHDNVTVAVVPFAVPPSATPQA
ncbi:protein phosphatase 2C domain-containing protein [Streptomyces sp. NPDC051211]|uniref:PP2C family serine/threonine-protein phosphatase n=1 Tax=Streptomyces sp. NPDC051211 TaxID=3154643 RepID=UPI00344F3171